jgi:prephenate dehydrogenase
MGGSLSLALKKNSLVGRTTGLVRNQKSLEEAVSLKIADEVLLEQEFLNRANWNDYDLIVFSLPVDLTCQKIRLVPENYEGHLTDLGSTKKEIVQSVEEKYSKPHNYISSHPMTGSENSGAKFSNEELYIGKLCILTKPKNAQIEVYNKIQFFWESLGSKVLEIPSEEHDEILSYLSHSPHILSNLLVTWAGMNSQVKTFTEKSPLPISGGGFRDMTRIAGSNPEMWEAIIATNKHYIYQSLVEFQNHLNDLIEKFHSPESSNGFWKSYFEKSLQYKKEILKKV